MSVTEHAEQDAGHEGDKQREGHDAAVEGYARDGKKVFRQQPSRSADQAAALNTARVGSSAAMGEIPVESVSIESANQSSGGVKEPVECPLHCPLGEDT
jgi:hypothetical protein